MPGAVTLRRSLRAVPACVPVLRAQVVEFLTEAGVSERQASAIKLAVSEAVTNAVVHGYADAEEPGEVRVVAFVDDDTVHLIVSDDGVGMVPRLDSPGLGVGLPVIANTADTLQIGESKGGGAELQMTFRLQVDS